MTLGPGGRRQTHSVSVSAPTTSQRDVGSEPVQAESRPERPGAGRRKQASHTGRPAEEAGAPVSHGSRDRTRRPEATGVSGRELLLGGPGEAQVEASGLVPPPGSWHTFFVCDKDVPPTGTHSAGSQPRGRDAQELVQGTGTSKGPTVALAGAGSGPPLTSAPRSRLPSSRPVTVLGPFFFLSLARMDDSRSGNGGISSRTVAWEGRSPGERGSKPRGARAAAGGRGGAAHQDVGAGYGAQPQVLHGPLLQLHVRVLQLAVAAQHVLDGGLHLREEVHELDVGGQEERSGGHAAQVELGVQQVELRQGAARAGRTGRGRSGGRPQRLALPCRCALGWSLVHRSPEPETLRLSPGEGEQGRTRGNPAPAQKHTHAPHPRSPHPRSLHSLLEPLPSTQRGGGRAAGLERRWPCSGLSRQAGQTVGVRTGGTAQHQDAVPAGLLKGRSPGPWVPGNEVPELPQDVAAHFDQVLVACWGLQCLWGRECEGKGRRPAVGTCQGCAGHSPCSWGVFPERPVGRVAPCSPTPHTHGSSTGAPEAETPPPSPIVTGTLLKADTQAPVGGQRQLGVLPRPCRHTHGEASPRRRPWARSVLRRPLESRRHLACGRRCGGRVTGS